MANLSEQITCTIPPKTSRLSYDSTSPKADLPRYAGAAWSRAPAAQDIKVVPRMVRHERQPRTDGLQHNQQPSQRPLLPQYLGNDPRFAEFQPGSPASQRVAHKQGDILPCIPAMQQGYFPSRTQTSSIKQPLIYRGQLGGMIHEKYAVPRTKHDPMRTNRKPRHIKNHVELDIGKGAKSVPGPATAARKQFQHSSRSQQSVLKTHTMEQVAASVHFPHQTIPQEPPIPKKVKPKPGNHNPKANTTSPTTNPLPTKNPPPSTQTPTNPTGKRKTRTTLYSMNMGEIKSDQQEKSLSRVRENQEEQESKPSLADYVYRDFQDLVRLGMKQENPGFGSVDDIAGLHRVVLLDQGPALRESAICGEGKESSTRTDNDDNDNDNDDDDDDGESAILLSLLSKNEHQHQDQQQPQPQPQTASDTNTTPNKIESAAVEFTCTHCNAFKGDICGVTVHALLCHGVNAGEGRWDGNGNGNGEGKGKGIRSSSSSAATGTASASILALALASSSWSGMEGMLVDLGE